MMYLKERSIMEKQCYLCKCIFDESELTKLDLLNEYVCENCINEGKAEEEYLEYMLATGQL